MRHTADSHNSCVEIFMIFTGRLKQWIVLALSDRSNDYMHRFPDMLLKSVYDVLNFLFMWLYTIGGLRDWWTGLVDWTTGLTDFH